MVVIIIAEVSSVICDRMMFHEGCCRLQIERKDRYRRVVAADVRGGTHIHESSDYLSKSHPVLVRKISPEKFVEDDR